MQGQKVVHKSVINTQKVVQKNVLRKWIYYYIMSYNWKRYLETWSKLGVKVCLTS